MSRLLTLVVLLFLSTPAWTEWTQVGNAADAAFGTYVDLATIRKTGNTVKMWSLLDFKTAQRTADGHTYFSGKTQDEYDCDGKRSKSLSFSLHSGRMGRGRLLSPMQSPVVGYLRPLGAFSSAFGGSPAARSESASLALPNVPVCSVRAIAIARRPLLYARNETPGLFLLVTPFADSCSSCLAISYPVYTHALTSDSVGRFGHVKTSRWSGRAYQRAFRGFYWIEPDSSGHPSGGG